MATYQGKAASDAVVDESRVQGRARAPYTLPASDVIAGFAGKAIPGPAGERAAIEEKITATLQRAR
jgi:hypothetical protein